MTYQLTILSYNNALCSAAALKTVQCVLKQAFIFLSTIMHIETINQRVLYTIQYFHSVFTTSHIDLPSDVNNINSLVDIHLVSISISEAEVLAVLNSLDPMQQIHRNRWHWTQSSKTLHVLYPYANPYISFSRSLYKNTSFLLTAKSIL